MSSNLSALQLDSPSNLEGLPLELLEEILSHLDTPTIKQLSLASSTLHSACFPYFFRNLALHGSFGPATKFLADFEKRVPISCLRTVWLEWVKEDVSTAIFPWCKGVHSVKINGSSVGNTAILPALTYLTNLELTNLSFPCLADYFRLLETLPLTVKSVKVRMITFRESQSNWIVGRRIELERLDIDSAADLAPFLRDDCPISPISLREVSLPYSSVRDLEVFLRRIPILLDLSIKMDKFEDIPVSFLFTKSKALSIIDCTRDTCFLKNLFAPSSDAPSPLESLNLTFSCNQWVSPQQVSRHLAQVFSQPRFHNLRMLHLNIERPLFGVLNSELSQGWHGWARRFELDLEAVGRIPRIAVSTVEPWETCRGYGFGNGDF
ncbi:uncharacterized protein EV420DRAFT_1769957 [Desarmillaria tabescens]|uniref:F-box domain-containing protein n=1 Tax=Armillaria tabescens TaxID=1929756 RepID=A0AA39J9B3_ARMTA|nr:uncharacterized protein EV420DRAFT_1769957 [Desarmillaria tabescens]KAK0437606.1 hypothetical protein EV420DRAFT_1769957 [Desarmillaria tabescens]